jgi:tripartite ATP-independent transporter DctM subunit
LIVDGETGQQILEKPYPISLRKAGFMGAQMTTAATAGHVLLQCAAAIERPIGYISRKAGALSAFLSLLMAATIVLDVAARYFFGTAIQFTMEGETLVLVMVTFLSLAETQKNGRHISIDLITSSLPAGVRLFNKTVFTVFGLCLFLVMSWELCIRGMQERADGAATLVSHIPLFPFSFLGTFGCLMISLVLFKELLENAGRVLTEFKRPLLVLGLILVVAAAIIVFPFMYRSLEIHASNTTLGVVMLAFALLLMFLGFPVAFAMAFVGFLGTWLLSGEGIALGFVRLAAFDSVAEYYLCVIPFFILMGLFCLNAGISKALFNSAHKWVGGFPGGLAIATVMGCGGFAAICGDSMANAATMGSVALPEMKKFKYHDSLATGSVAAGGTLGILIPPSIGFIAYAIVTQESVGKLFIAGILPGLLLMFLFCATILLRCKWNPSLGPASQGAPWRDKILSLRGTWQVILLFALVMGGIYSGATTPTEAGGVGVLGALVLAAFSSEFSWKKLYESVTDGIQMSVMIMAMLIGVAILNNFILLTGLPAELSNFLQSLNLSRYVFFVCVMILYLVLGMVMNIIPMIMVTLPIIFPSILALGFDPIWFGVVMVIMMEMGQISPPVGINVFVIAAVAKDVPMERIFRGILPFAVSEVAVIIILTVYPKIALFLPNLMNVLPPITR